MDLVEVLGEELADQVKEKIDDDVLLVKEENHVTKTSFNDELEEKKHYKDLYEDAKEQMKEFEGLADKNQELKEKLQDVNEKLENKDDEWSDKLAKTKKEAALDLAFSDAKHPELLKQQVDYEKLKYDFDSGEVTGVDEIKKEYQEKYEDLFGEESSSAGGEDFKGGGKSGNDDLGDMDMESYINAREENKK